MSDVAAELGADWHAINDAVIAYGQALLDADVNRVGAVEALGVDARGHAVDPAARRVAGNRGGRSP